LPKPKADLNNSKTHIIFLNVELCRYSEAEWVDDMLGDSFLVQRYPLSGGNPTCDLCTERAHGFQEKKNEYDIPHLVMGVKHEH
jgi:hypothetical protein